MLLKFKIMSRKTGVVKTYGRHKFRIVKSQPWSSPDDDFQSPITSYERFPSNNIKAVPSTNFKPKSSVWSKPSNSRARRTIYRNGAKSSPFDVSIHSGKENVSDPALIEEVCDLVPASRYTRRKQSLFSGGTTFSTSKRSVLTTPGESSNYSCAENSVILANDTQENGTDHHCSIEDMSFVEDIDGNLSPYNRSANQPTCARSSGSVSFHPDSPSCIHESKYGSVNRSSGGDNLSHISESSSGKEIRSRNSQDLEDVKNGFCSFSSTRMNVYSSSCRNDFDLALRRSQPCQVTSTPVFGKKNSPSSGDKSEFEGNVVMNGKVMLEPLTRITPIRCESSVALGKKTIAQNTKVFSDLSNSKSSPNELRKMSTNSEEVKTLCKNTRGQSSVTLKECVVALKKLRLTPLISSKQLKKCSARALASKACAYSTGKSQLSFVEALTPVKTTQRMHNIDYQEEVELSAFDKVLLECGQERPAKLTEFLEASTLDECVKIGEGVYGEVFRTQNKQGNSVALKIIPVEGDFPVNGEPQKSFEEILPEIVISKELSLLGDTDRQELQMLESMSTSFIRVHSVTCCRDKYPSNLITEWDRWNERNSSENDRPDIFPSDQYFIVFEFSNGGRDLESFEFSTQSEAWSVLHQAALGLAVAENALEYEHRDLHWGNVLIRRTDSDFLESRLFGETKSVASHGVHVSLIDFTLSRLTKDGLTVFCNLAEDKSMFTGKGDYQFDVYRLMKKANQNDWEPFNPYTNVLWLHYLADKMLKKKKYAIKDKTAETNLRRFLRQARKSSSATEIVQDFFD